MSLWTRLCSIRGLVSGVREEALNSDPVVEFGNWYRAARRAGVPLPHSMTLATATAGGEPSARIVFLKSFDPQGFVFYTNYDSRKASEIAGNPAAALLFHWSDLWRQVRVEGRLTKVSEAESDAYFRSRPRKSQLGAWASRQSSAIPGREHLLAEFAKAEARFAGGKVPRPPGWGGYRLRPQAVEFWQGRMHRLHDRFLYKREGDGWRRERLAP
jgi:pyridoxamine 5'-phosphate oxidase